MYTQYKIINIYYSPYCDHLLHILHSLSNVDRLHHSQAPHLTYSHTTTSSFTRAKYCVFSARVKLAVNLLLNFDPYSFLFVCILDLKAIRTQFSNYIASSLCINSRFSAVSSVACLVCESPLSFQRYVGSLQLAAYV